MPFYAADAHCDFLYYMLQNGWSIDCPKANQAVALPYLNEGGVKLQCFAIWRDTKLRLSCLQQGLDTAEAYLEMLDTHEELVPFSSGFDPEDGRIATVLTIEGGEVLNGSKSNLRLFYRLGVRSLALTWNETNELAAPAMRRGNKGLTALGREMVSEMERIGMSLDVAHLSDAGIDEALELYHLPVIASHSNARAVMEHPRSLTDERIERIAAGGGVVCVNFYPPQLSEGRAQPSDVVKHILHIIKVAGINAVGIGSDFDGMTAYPPGLCHSSDLISLAEMLLESGLTAAEAERVMYGNLRDYYLNFV